MNNKILGAVTTYLMARSPRLRKYLVLAPIAFGVVGFVLNKLNELNNRKSTRGDGWQVQPLSGVHVV